MMDSEGWRSKLGALMGSMPATDEPEEETATEAEPELKEKARLDIILERKGRAGKTATIISGFTVPDEAVGALASDLKRCLGTGGSARGGEILIQGDRRRDVLAFLTGKGYKARII